MKKKNIFKVINLKNDKLNLFELISTIIIFAIMILIIASPKQYAEGTIEGIKLFFYSVFPGLFPFMLLTKLLTEMGYIEKVCAKLDKISYRLFSTNGLSLYAFFMSILSGYPIGAKIISDLFKKDLITESEAKKMSIFCTTSGPIFVIGTVGIIMFNNIKIGIIIYLSHILSSLILGIISGALFREKEINFNKKRKINTKNTKNIVNLCINETISSLFIVGAYITIFYLIGEILDSIKIFNLLKSFIQPLFNLFNINKKYTQGVLYGILEVTRGAKNLSFFKTNISITLTTALISFSGLSIIFQSMTFLKEAKIKKHNFIFTKIVHSIFSMIICFIFIKLFL